MLCDTVKRMLDFQVGFFANLSLRSVTIVAKMYGTNTDQRLMQEITGWWQLDHTKGPQLNNVKWPSNCIFSV